MSCVQCDQEMIHKIKFHPFQFINHFSLSLKMSIISFRCQEYSPAFITCCLDSNDIPRKATEGVEAYIYFFFPVLHSVPLSIRIYSRQRNGCLRRDLGFSAAVYHLFHTDALCIFHRLTFLHGWMSHGGECVFANAKALVSVRWARRKTCSTSNYVFILAWGCERASNLRRACCIQN